MAALRKPAALVTGIMACAGTAASASAPPSLQYFTHGAAMDCIEAASKSGVSREAFESSSDWLARDDTDGFRHRDLPITIDFPADDDGVERICVVEADLASKAEQKALLQSFRKSLGRPIKQSDSHIWLRQNGKDFRGLQFYFDDDSDQPHVRLIGAQF